MWSPSVLIKEPIAWILKTHDSSKSSAGPFAQLWRNMSVKLMPWTASVKGASRPSRIIPWGTFRIRMQLCVRRKRQPTMLHLYRHPHPKRTLRPSCGPQHLNHSPLLTPPYPRTVPPSSLTISLRGTKENALKAMLRGCTLSTRGFSAHPPRGRTLYPTSSPVKGPLGSRPSTPNRHLGVLRSIDTHPWTGQMTFSQTPTLPGYAAVGGLPLLPGSPSPPHLLGSHGLPMSPGGTAPRHPRFPCRSLGVRSPQIEASSTLLRRGPLCLPSCSERWQRCRPVWMNPHAVPSRKRLFGRYQDGSYKRNGRLTCVMCHLRHLRALPRTPSSSPTVHLRGRRNASERTQKSSSATGQDADHRVSYIMTGQELGSGNHAVITDSPSS